VTSHHNTSAVARTDTVAATTTATAQLMYASGSITRAANGGYVNPYDVPGFR
jgi:hypothetical protein